MASRLLDCGYQVIIWNRSYKKAIALIEKGATWEDTPALAAAKADAVLAMVADDPASNEVWTGQNGAFNTMQPGSVMIECSTLSARHVAYLSGLANEKGFIYIDCPVTGLPDAAAQGKLTLLVGAGPEDLQLAEPVLKSIADHIIHFGATGTGTAYKLMINLMGAVQIAALAEGIALAERVGLDKETVINAITQSAAASPQVVRYVRKMAEKNFSAVPSFTTSLRFKDARYGLELAESVGSRALLGQVAASWFEKADNARPDDDEATVINVIGR